MKIRINTIMAHPTLGTAEPGTILDVPEADAQPLLDSKVAERVEPVKKTERMETAKLDDDDHENAMQASHYRSGKPPVR
ncbi:MAG TPA: hypothetical protein VH187_01590 [Scandinavium sp.]|jgi:hypothetical protein|uniref:hypothetical protein n=1 Tax=Scandinavium sp. TaxID=2830653 RepID=UPI002E3537C2|nr:hypothetical protein [Scandinavium sp.]HEX4499851.1 hypothetical protein [Scandinavium sp.]